MSEQKPKLLIIDDDRGNFIQQSVFIEPKFELKHVDNGMSGLEVAKEWQPDAILLDFLMPGMDGIEVLRNLKANPETAHILVVMISQLGDSELTLKAIRMGAEDYIKRADGIDILVAKLDRIVVARLRERELADVPMPEAPTTEEAVKRIFLSYSSKDVDFATALKSRIESAGFDAWIDHEYIKGGQRWMAAIENALATCDAMVLILSPDALESVFVRAEYLAIIRQNKPLLPIIVHPCEPPFILQTIQHRNHHKDGNRAIEQILADLREILA